MLKCKDSLLFPIFFLSSPTPPPARVGKCLGLPREFAEHGLTLAPPSQGLLRFRNLHGFHFHTSQRYDSALATSERLGVSQDESPSLDIEDGPSSPGQTNLTCLLADGWLASARTEGWKPVNLCLKLSPLHARVEPSLLSHHLKSGPSLIPRGETRQNFQCSGGKGNINPT